MSETHAGGEGARGTGDGECSRCEDEGRTVVEIASSGTAEGIEVRRPATKESASTLATAAAVAAATSAPIVAAVLGALLPGAPSKSQDVSIGAAGATSTELTFGDGMAAVMQLAVCPVSVAGSSASTSDHDKETAQPYDVALSTAGAFSCTAGCTYPAAASPPLTKLSPTKAPSLRVVLMYAATAGSPAPLSGPSSQKRPWSAVDAEMAVPAGGTAMSAARAAVEPPLWRCARKLATLVSPSLSSLSPAHPGSAGAEDGCSASSVGRLAREQFQESAGGPASAPGADPSAPRPPSTSAASSFAASPIPWVMRQRARSSSASAPRS